jgi:hypothetical protein
MFSPILRDFKEADQGYNTTDTDLDAHWKKSQHKYIANARIIRSARDLERLSKFPSYDNNHIRRAYENLLANQGLEVEISTQRAIEMSILPPSEEDQKKAVEAVEYAVANNEEEIRNEHKQTLLSLIIYWIEDYKKEKTKKHDLGRDVGYLVAHYSANQRGQDPQKKLASLFVANKPNEIESDLNIYLTEKIDSLVSEYSTKPDKVAKKIGDIFNIKPRKRRGTKKDETNEAMRTVIQERIDKLVEEKSIPPLLGINSELFKGFSNKQTIEIGSQLIEIQNKNLDNVELMKELLKERESIKNKIVDDTANLKINEMISLTSNLTKKENLEEITEEDISTLTQQLTETKKTELIDAIRERELAENKNPARQKFLLTVAFTVLTIIVATALVIYGYELFGNLNTWGMPVDWLTAFVVGILAERLEKPTTNLIDTIAEAIKKLGKGKDEDGDGGDAGEIGASAATGDSSAEG